MPGSTFTRRLHSRVLFTARRENASPLDPPPIGHRASDAVADRQLDEPDETVNTEAPIILIDPHKIDDFARFRMIFVGMLLFINSSTQGLHALFALYMEQVYAYDVGTMVNIYASGTAFGLFVFPFGVLYDYFGPKIVIGIATIITPLSHLLFGLTFSGHIEASVLRFCIYFAMMNWGCYAFDVAALPAVLTHAPRDRAQPTGLLKTFSGLGASLISCLFRGFFDNHFDHLMYFLAALVLFFGVIGTICISDAPYRINRWENSRITLKERLRRYLIRNRYMSQLIPKRRFGVLAALLLVLNVYLSIQAICAGFYRDTMTERQYRGLAIGAILIVLCVLFMVVPIHAIDGHTKQDDAVVQKAREKERELAEKQELRMRRLNDGGGAAHESVGEGEDQTQQQAEDEKVESDVIEIKTPSLNALGQTSLHVSETALPYGSSSHHNRSRKNADEEHGTPGHTYRPVEPEANLIEAEGLVPLEERSETAPRLTQRWMNNASIVSNIIPSAAPSRVGDDEPGAAEMDVVTREVSTYNRPYVETITVCGEVFVPPVYETTFLQSLTYVDLWLLWYTVFVVWGVGMALTANWNIRVMASTIFTGLEYKTYVLFATMAGISTAFGRVVMGPFEVFLLYLGKKRGVMLPATIALPVPSAVLALAVILYLSVPGNYSLILVYLLTGTAYGFSTSLTVYLLCIIFRHDIGMHYGFCWFGASLGIVLLYRVLFFHVYDRHKLVLPPGAPIDTHGICLGRDCMRTTLIVYLVLLVSSIFAGYWLHYRYWKLVQGKMKYKRVITHFVKKRIQRISERMHKEDGAGGGNAQ